MYKSCRHCYSCACGISIIKLYNAVIINFIIDFLHFQLKYQYLCVTKLDLCNLEVAEADFYSEKWWCFSDLKSSNLSDLFEPCIIKMYPDITIFEM